MKRHKDLWAVASVGILLLLGAIIFRAKSTLTLAAARPTPARVNASYRHGNVATSKPRILDAYGKLPMAFEANRGQTDRRVKFLSLGSGYSVFLTSNEAVLALHKASSVKPQRVNDEPWAQQSAESRNGAASLFAGPSGLGNPESKTERLAGEGPSVPAILRMKLVGAKSGAKVTGLKQLPGKSNYFIGNDPKKWHTQVPTYAQVRYQDAYPGIDLVYYGHQGQLEYDFVVAPGASPKAIIMAIAGTGHDAPLRIDREGDLVAALDDGEVCFHKPVVYQPAGAERNYVDGRYVLKGEHEVGFEIAASDPMKPLVIDPTLSYSTYLGGSSYDYGQGIALDSAGNAYVTGYTGSTDFPTSNPLQPTNHGGWDAFVAALDPAGATLLYSTYLGGSGNDFGQGIAVDGTGNVYVTGDTTSTDFPTSNPLQPTNHGISDAFVAAIDPTGTTLRYSTYLGGSGYDYCQGIAVDSAGNAYVTGQTTSTNFPTSNPLQPTNHGEWDAFVAAIDRTGATLLYSTYLGGSSDDAGYGIAVDSAGDAYVTGYTWSPDFPTSNPLQPTNHGVSDAFVAALDRTGTTLVYSTYLRGSSNDVGRGIAVDGAGNAYVTGYTLSLGEISDFPTSNPLQPTNHGGYDAFVAALDPTGATLLYSTYLGGSGDDYAQGIAVDSAGNAYVTGYTLSTDFPTSNPLQPTNHGSYEAFVAKIAP